MAATFLTFNCNGLRKSSKQVSLRATIQNLRPSFFFLQDTHLLPEEKIIIHKDYKSFFSGFSKQSAGVSIHIHNQTQLSHLNTITDPNGRYLITTAKYKRQTLLLCNVYAPNVPSERRTFMKK